MKKLLLPIIIIIFPLALLWTHTVYVAAINDFDDTNLLKVEKNLQNDPAFSKYYVKVQFKENSFYGRSDSDSNYQVYHLTGRGTEYFANLESDERKKALKEIHELLLEKMDNSNTIACGSNQFCKVIGIVVLDPKENNPYLMSR